MAVPKQKKSKAKSKSRNAQNIKFAKPNIQGCPNCGATIRPHHICEECGYYKAAPVLPADGYSEYSEE